MKIRAIILGLLALVGIALAQPASGQGAASMRPCVGINPCVPVDATHPLPITPGTSPSPQPTTFPTNITPTDCSGSISSGGVAQNAFTASATRHGFIIANIDTSEVMWISWTGTASASGAGSFPLAPAMATTFAGLSSFASPPGFGINTALSVFAATTSHKFSCTVY
jgi:hypothetical protein